MANGPLIIDLMHPVDAVLQFPTIGRVSDKNVDIPLWVKYDGMPYDLTGHQLGFYGRDAKGVAKIALQDPVGPAIEAGRVTFTMPGAAFQAAGEYQEAWFRIEKDGQLISSQNVKFNVLENNVEFGVDDEPYYSDVEKLITELKNDTAKSKDDALSIISEFETKFQAEYSKVTSLSNEMTTQMKWIIDQLDLIKAKVQSSDIATKSELEQALLQMNKDIFESLKQKADKTYIDNYLAKITYVPTTFVDLNALQAKYPSGANGLYITADTGHKFIWDGSAWKDCGAYQSAGLADGSVTIDKLSNNAFTYVSSDNMAFHRTAMSRGFNNYEKLKFEVGTISGADGSDVEANNTVRTALGAMNYQGIAVFTFNPSKYQWKLAQYDANRKFVKFLTDWNSGQNNHIDFESGQYYRLLVSTIDSSAIDANDVLLNVKVASLNNKMTYNLGDLTRNFDHMITIGGGAEPEISVDKSQNIKITMPANPLIMFDGMGSNVAVSPVAYNGITFTLTHANVLVWNLQKNTISVQAISDNRDKLNVILADNIYGQINNGFFSQFYDRKIARNDVGYQINIAGNNHPSFVSNSDNSLDVIMPNSSLVYFNHFGKQIKISDSKYYGKAINLPTSSVLLWNFDTNEIVAQPQESERPVNSIILANNIYKHVTSGYFEQYFKEQFGPEYADSYRAYAEQNIAYNDQDITVVGDELWIGLQSSPDHDAAHTGQIIRLDRNLKQVGRYVHNLGHLNTMDYCANNDTLLVGNASDEASAVPEIILIPNVSKLKVDPDWPLIDYNSDTVIKIKFPDISPMGIGAVFGETPDVAYLLIGGAPGMNSVVKIELGMGASDLSCAGYGAFIKNTDGYNGTAQYVRRYYGRTMEVNQGATFYNGKIYGAFCRSKTHFAKITLHEPQLTNHDGFYSIEDWTIADYGTEPNGMAIYDGLYMRTTYDGKLVDMPLSNRQGGQANIGETVKMPFRGSNIQITPTSPVTDLYVEVVDGQNFTVKSASEKTGTCNWTAAID
ncbi:BppU family phage baseplate upper protein [Pediococcus pentosaceus]